MIKCDTNRYEGDDFGPVYIRAMDIARSHVNVLAFASGITAIVVLHSVIDPSGKKDISIIADPSVVANCTALRVTSAVEDQERLKTVINLFATEPALFMALDDLIVSVWLPHISMINCGRALDGLRKIMEPPGASVDTSWTTIRQNLNLSKPYLKLISDTSTDPRHGDRTHIPGTTVNEVLGRTWAVMSRFIEFRLRGNKPLPESEFPLL
jgi:hypothetical protein